ncbi:inorganic pyrophosphatase [Obelidium mucronatum]|nr:inorganic pyrophosphatase [Obelidium mucronatum]
MSNMSEYKTRVVGAPNTLEHRVYIENSQGKVVSPFHDIPLFANAGEDCPEHDFPISPMCLGTTNYIKPPRNQRIIMKQEDKVEVETGSLDSYISKDEAFNPIKQDIKKGKLRFVRNCFPHHGYIWNYGAFPQTWEDPTSIHPDTKAKGDNDPLDVCEIGEAVGTVGQVKQVKVLGTMALLDEVCLGQVKPTGRLSSLTSTTQLASKLNDIEDVEKHLPGILRASNEWFRIYKIPDGKPENNFAFSGEAKNKAYANEVIHETNEAWKRLITRQIPSQTEHYDITVANTEVADSPYKVAVTDAAYTSLPADSRKPAAAIDASIDKWFYLSGKPSNL